jgi:Rod binding domain-containing protein
MIAGLPPLLVTPTAAGRDDPQRTQAAAGEFEALLIGSLLKSMREAGSSGWLGTGEDQTSESLLELAEQQLAQLMAAQGGLGLARLVVQGLSRPEPAAADTNAPGGR